MDQNKKTLRSFQCRDYLWEIFGQMSAELECSVDYLINEAMRQYARSRNYGVRSPSTPGMPSPRTAPPPAHSGPPPGPPPAAPSIPSVGKPPSRPPIPSAPPPPRPGPTPGAYGAAAYPPQAAPPQAPPPQASPPGYGGYPAAPPQYPPTAAPYAAPPPGYPQAPPPGAYPPAPPAARPGYGGAPQAPAPRPSAPPPLPGSGAPSAMPGARPTLFVIFNGQKIPVTKDEFVIGRGSKTADLPIKDGNISRRHAAVVFQGGAFYMKDLGSTNGIEHLGRRIDSKRIDEGDVFAVCDYEIRFTYR